MPDSFNNDLSWLNQSTPDTDLLVLIWFPKTAEISTYTELARLRPSMTPQIARACINANYQDLFNSLNSTPGIFLWRAAEKSRNSHYLEKIEQKETELGLDRSEFSELDVPIEEFASMWPERPDVTDTWPIAVLDQEIDPMFQEDLVLVRDITIEIPSLVENLLLNTCLADPSIRPSPPLPRIRSWRGV